MTSAPRAGLTGAQVTQLLRPINPARVLTDGKGHSHVSQQDVTAHLIRLFGVGGFDTEILDVACVFETERCDPRTGKPTGRWDCCYRALLRLTIKDPEGRPIACYEDGSTGVAQNQTRGDAHDLAYKSALSLAKKRTAINLGDQFGLSLYNGGQLAPLVMNTLVRPATGGGAGSNGTGSGGDAREDGDVQEGVAQQVTLGNDETDRPLAAGPADADADWTLRFTERLNNASTLDDLRSCWNDVINAFKEQRIDETTANTARDQLIRQREALNGAPS